MKLRITGIAVAMVFMLAAACFGANGTAPAAPLAVVPQPIYKFNSALDGEEIVHDFVIRNQGNAELQIYKVETG